jgi:hypothetical protein
MAGFITELNTKCINDDKWELITPLIYDSDVLQKQVVIPKGFSCDFASVPRLPLAYLLAGGTAHKAAVVHDWLYRENGCTRKQADETFLEAMKVTGISAWRRRIMYWGVRVGAGMVWDRYRRENV